MFLLPVVGLNQIITSESCIHLVVLEILVWIEWYIFFYGVISLTIDKMSYSDILEILNITGRLKYLDDHVISLNSTSKKQN